MANCFPGAYYRREWSSAQSKFLKSALNKLSADTLNYSFSPASDKTSLALQIILTADKPTLVITAFEEDSSRWISAFEKDFFAPFEKPDFISALPSSAKPLIVMSYKDVYAECFVKGKVRRDIFFETLNKAGVRLIVCDNSNEFPQDSSSLIKLLLSGINSPQLFSFNSRLPFYIEPRKLHNYVDTFGVLDGYYSSADKIKEGENKPYRDFLVLTFPNEKENEQITRQMGFTGDIVGQLCSDRRFISAIREHPWFIAPEKYEDEILSMMSRYIIMAQFLKAAKADIPHSFFDITGLSYSSLGELNLDTLAEMLSFCLFLDKDRFSKIDFLINTMRSRLKLAGFINENEVVFSGSKNVRDTLRYSASKFEQAAKIVLSETEKMKDSLRLMILTDEARAEEMPSKEGITSNWAKTGIIPFFEMLRSMNRPDVQPGAFYDRSIIVSDAVFPHLRAEITEAGADINRFSATIYPGAHNFALMTFPEEYRQISARAFSEMINKGFINCAVCNKEIFSSGRFCAPNTIIFPGMTAPFNQFAYARGLALTGCGENDICCSAHIWHILCVRQDEQNPAEWKDAQKFFNSFEGLSIGDIPSVETGISRLGGQCFPPFSLEKIEENNQKMFALAQDREKLPATWTKALSAGKNLRAEALFDKNIIPFHFVRRNFQQSFLLSLLCVLSVFIVKNLSGITESGVSDVIVIFFIAVFASALLFILPRLISDFLKLLRHRNQVFSLKSVADALIQVFWFGGIADKRAYADIGITGDNIYCALAGADTGKESLFAHSLIDILHPFGFPKYMLVKNANSDKFEEGTSFPVPKIISARRKTASYFKKIWGRFVADTALVSTDTKNGRKIFLKAYACGFSGSASSILHRPVSGAGGKRIPPPSIRMHYK